VALDPASRDLGLLHDALYPKPTKLLTVGVAIGLSEPVEALIDGGSQLNLLSAVLAKEHDLPVQPLPKLLAEGVNGKELKVYGTTRVAIRITDSRRKTETQDVPFIVADVQKYQVYLGLPWIDTYNPKISYQTRRLILRGTKSKDRTVYQKIAVEEAEEFEKTMRDPSADVYGCLVASVVQTDPEGAGGYGLPPQYAEFAELGSEDDSRVLADHGPQDLAISLLPGATVPHQPLYNLSRTELELLRKYLDEYLARGWIRHSKSPAGAPILFAKKKDGSMRLCVDYRGLNKVTVKNRHPLPLITESLERLASARFYTKLDVKEAYHRVRIQEGDEWKTAFRTRYGSFEYTVMPFGLTNAPAQFQAYIHQVLAGLVDVSCIVYLDDILIFSSTEEEHVRQVREVLRRLRDAKLYLKLPKCEWHTQRTEYLGYVVSPEGIEIDQDRVKTIQEWPEPRTVREIRVFIGFMNYYRRFIANFSQLALPLTKLTQKGPEAARGGHAQRREESQVLVLNKEAKEAFQKLKDSFLNVPILAHFERDRKTRAEVDASGGAIAGILSQFVPDQHGKGQWRPVDFFSRKLVAAEYNYDTHDQELLAIVKSLEHWRQYLEGVHFELLTDHQNLKWFMETKTLNHRQVRAYIILSGFDFTINHRPGTTNPADGPSRRPDYMAEAQKPAQKYNEAFVQPMKDILSSGNQKLLVAAVSTRSANRAEGQETLMKALKEFRRADKHHTPEPCNMKERGETDCGSSATSDESEPEETQSGPDGATANRYATRTPTTVDEKARAIQVCHDSPLSGHFGARRTLEKLQRRYAWKGMRKDVEQYCKDCLICRKSTPARHRPYGPLQPLPIPDYPWEEVTMDFVTELPPSKCSGAVYDAILVIVDRLTKMAHYVPARADWDGADLAQAWIREVIRLHGVPKRIISDRGPLMNSKHWDTFLHYLNARRVLTSAFHPQTDGQTERQNQTLEQYLRCYCSLEQDDWALWISVGEYAYNDSMHSTTGVTPFQAYYGRHPRSADWPDMALGEGESPMGARLAEKVIELQQECRRKIKAANAYQKAYADKHRSAIPFKVGDQVLVSNRHIRSMRPKKKLDWKFLGPGAITAQIGPSAFRVDLPGLRNVHPVFHASLLEPFSPEGAIPHPEAPKQDTLLEYGDDVYEVERIVERRRNEDDQWEYLVKWAGYPEEENSWELGANISANTLQKFWNDKGIQQRRKSTKGKPVKRRRGRPRKEGG
jgi:hypothetical protein